MQKIRIAVVGFGNIGRFAIEAIETAQDCELVGIVRRSVTELPAQFQKYRQVTNIEELGEIDVAIISQPTRAVPEMASSLLSKGINTVDSFDIHGEIADLRRKLNIVAKEHGVRAVLAAGWDPGSDSVIRTLMQAMIPQGITYTDFGPGMSMGHSVAARAIEGVADALSMTIPVGTSIHRRMVYVELKEGYTIEDVSARLKADDYFSHDETHVIAVPSVDALKDMGHGVNMSRKGVSGKTHNQLLHFDMKINNPALTAQILVASARAAMRQKPGAYTLPEIPPIDLLPGERDEWIEKLV
ncbi:diaminopimelate dehydrogenase [Porphyromonas sp.]|uniref:diaminopimelate dehydrogenase n=1 Tax=Porphyromonas sp. TaxID=1924944 RepID=UPI0026DABCDF|nr:diaminopimelate dehydrogenase [Porphyromonas sp.]MDO4695862.1 diaminopimelate dehydrogenase [Porphyromonas sp.]MDO4771804.1 diaminopimelate dehydrogenase [Porphyromonas sp.]